MNIDLSKISASRVILWLAAITIVSFFLGFVILAYTGGLTPLAERSLSHTESYTPYETTSGVFSADDARSADVFISLGAANLTVRSGADKKYLMEYNLTINNPEWRPVIIYSIDNFNGNLRITEKETERDMMFPATLVNSWDVRLNDEIPLTLEVNTGVGDSKLNVGSLNLSVLRVKMGAGNQVVDFTGYSGHLQDSEITCGVGDITVRVPKDMNSRISVDNGVGDIRVNGLVRKDGVYWVSGNPDPLTGVTNIDVKLGVGSVTLEAV
jgi:hypothetical protein